MDISQKTDRNKNVGDHMPIFSEKRGNCKYCYLLVTGKRRQGAENRTNIKFLCCEVYLCINKNRNCCIEFHKKIMMYLFHIISISFAIGFCHVVIIEKFICHKEIVSNQKFGSKFKEGELRNKN